MLGVAYTITRITDAYYAAVTSVTSAAILPKIIVSRCVDVVPTVAHITVYCSVFPADYPCATSTWGVL